MIHKALLKTRVSCRYRAGKAAAMMLKFQSRPATVLGGGVAIRVTPWVTVTGAEAELLLVQLSFPRDRSPRKLTKPNPTMVKWRMESLRKFDGAANSGPIGARDPGILGPRGWIKK